MTKYHRPGGSNKYLLFVVLEAGKSKINELVDLVFDEVLPGSSTVKESTCHPGDPGLIPWLGRSAGEGIGYPL